MALDMLPHASLIHAISRQQTEDLTDLFTLISQISDAKELVAYSSLNREVSEDAVDLLYSVACTASLAGYRRDEPFRLIIGSLPEIVDLLDQTRAELIRLRPSMLRALRRSRQTVSYARAWSVLILALDAAGPDLPVVQMYSPVSARSGDPQGDAQQHAEDIYADNTPA
ncbi:hypothetical protein [Paracoccus sp. SSK6]|uniref:hypothetical protein n=1 Tax=Paracoccus sp. SSK6 TaxID=3143131 RepID=UPI00321BE175